MMSLTATGTPHNGPVGWPSARRSSSARACASTCSRSKWANALISGSAAAMRSRQAREYSSIEIVPRAISSAASVAVRVTSLSSAMPASYVSMFGGVPGGKIVRQPQRHLRTEIYEPVVENILHRPSRLVFPDNGLCARHLRHGHARADETGAVEEIAPRRFARAPLSGAHRRLASAG